MEPSEFSVVSDLVGRNEALMICFTNCDRLNGYLFIERTREREWTLTIVTSSSASIVSISITNDSQTNIANKFLNMLLIYCNSDCYRVILIQIKTKFYSTIRHECLCVVLLARALIIFVTFDCLLKNFLYGPTKNSNEFDSYTYFRMRCVVEFSRHWWLSKNIITAILVSTCTRFLLLRVTTIHCKMQNIINSFFFSFIHTIRNSIFSMFTSSSLARFGSFFFCV